MRHAQHQLGADADEAKATLDDAVVEISAAIEDLRELAHGRADQVVLQVARQNSTLVVSVADDGVGGAAVGGGSGLTGLSDRVASRGGRLRIESARGHGTTLIAELPCVS
jgi:glucose-6-phosphate-specific signal transduction histidine kinase